MAHFRYNVREAAQHENDLHKKRWKMNKIKCWLGWTEHTNILLQIIHNNNNFGILCIIVCFIVNLCIFVTQLIFLLDCCYCCDFAFYTVYGCLFFFFVRYFILLLSHRQIFTNQKIFFSHLNSTSGGDGGALHFINFILFV